MAESHCNECLTVGLWNIKARALPLNSKKRDIECKYRKGRRGKRDKTVGDEILRACLVALLA
jgi:hypothetical protein